MRGSRIGCAKIDTNGFRGRHRCGGIRRVDGWRVDATLSFYKSEFFLRHSRVFSDVPQASSHA